MSTSRTANARAGPGPSATAYRGIRGFFTRSRVTSPAPGQDPHSRGGPTGTSRPSTAQSRVDDISRTAARHSDRGQPGTAPSAPLKVGHPSTAGTAPVELPKRATSPNSGIHRVRRDPALLPAMQKGDDGRWQPPSLSRGSMSTSALQIFGGDDQIRNIEANRPKPTLSSMSSSRFLNQGSRHVSIQTRREEGQAVPASTSLASPPAKGFHLTGKIFPPAVEGGIEAESELNQGLDDLAHTGHSSERQSIRARISNDQISPMAPPPIPIRANSSQSASPEPLSKGHYLLRLATSLLVKRLAAVVNGPAAGQNGRSAEARKVANVHWTSLVRLERTWITGWNRICDVMSLSTATEDTVYRIRAITLGERAKQRERLAWIDAVRDGVLFCFLVNHIFPAHPLLIPRVNLANDEALRVSNMTRFIAACDTLGIPREQTFNLTDVQEATEASMGRMAVTVIFLARLAGRPQSGTSSPSSHSRPQSRHGTGRPGISPIKRQGTSLITSGTNSAFATASPNPIEKSTEHPGVEPHLLLQHAHGVPHIEHAVTIETPTTSVFTQAPVTPRTVEAVDLRSDWQPMGRTVTQTTLQAKPQPTTPEPSSPSRAKTPPGRDIRSLASSPPRSPGALRPALRARYTTGSARVQITFPEQPQRGTPKADLPSRLVVASSEAVLHSRERTPSLVSSGSRITSGYTRSSTAFSIATVIGETLLDGNSAVGSTEEEDRVIARPDIKERRMSEQTLHDARQKIIGTLLNTDETQTSDVGVNGQMRSDETARTVAISQSLAALEGSRPHRAEHGSPTKVRSISRRGQSLDPSRLDNRPPSESIEDDWSTPLTASSSLIGEARPPVMTRRLSANGKFYIPKRSTSPALLGSEVVTSNDVPSRPSSVHTRPAISPVFPSFPAFPAQYPNRSATELGMEHRQWDAQNMYRSAFAKSDSSVAFTGEDQGGIKSGQSSSIDMSGSAGRRSLQSGRTSQSSGGQILIVESESAPGTSVKYQVGNCIGKGQFGSVYRSLDLRSGRMVAIKRINLQGMREEEVCDVMREVEVLRCLSHPSIVRYEGVKREEAYLNIILEFVENGSLGQTLKSFGKFNEMLVASYVVKILEGLIYLHSEGVVHCDLKAANILTTKNGNIKLSDFGVSLNKRAVENIRHEAVTASRNGGKVSLNEVAGTPHWMAPEVIELNGASFASDIWSLGCTIVELLTGKPPYAEMSNGMTVLFRIVEDAMPPIPEVSDKLRNFLELCFIKDPAVRPSATALAKHSWLTQIEEGDSRPQDSIPFHQRLIFENSQSQYSRLFPDLKTGSNVKRRSIAAPVEELKPAIETPRRSRHSLSDARNDQYEGRKAHTLIKITFSKAVLCRVCQTTIKKAGTVCQDCGLICHTTCATVDRAPCVLSWQMASHADKDAHQTRQQGGVAALSRRHSGLPSAETMSKVSEDLAAMSAKFWRLSTKFAHHEARGHQAPDAVDPETGIARTRSTSQAKTLAPANKQSSQEITLQSDPEHEKLDVDVRVRRHSAIRFELAPPVPSISRKTSDVRVVEAAEARDKGVRSDCTVM